MLGSQAVVHLLVPAFHPVIQLAVFSQYLMAMHRAQVEVDAIAVARNAAVGTGVKRCSRRLFGEVYSQRCLNPRHG